MELMSKRENEDEDKGRMREYYVWRRREGGEGDGDRRREGRREEGLDEGLDVEVFFFH